MTDFTEYIKNFFYYMSYKTVYLIHLMNTGTASRKEIVRHCLLTLLLKRLSNFESSEDLDGQELPVEDYRNIQNLLNNYLKTNITYGRFDYSKK